MTLDPHAPLTPLSREEAMSRFWKGTDYLEKPKAMNTHITLRKIVNTSRGPRIILLQKLAEESSK